jgi:TolB protein
LVDTGHGLLCTQHEARRCGTRRRRLQALAATALVGVAGGAALSLVARSPAATGSASSALSPIARPPPEGVYFAEDRGGNWDVFYLVYASRAERRLTTHPADDLDPANNFSNAGLLLFSSNRDDGDFEIYSMGRDGMAQTRLTATAGADRHPDWSPWQSHVVFESTRHGAEDLYVMRADGTEQARITHAPGYDGQGQWTSNVRSPVGGSDAGTDIAFVSDRDKDLEIYLVKPDGSELRRLTFSPGADQLPAWSPDGARIAFISDRDGNREIYVMNADGSGQTRLTHHPAADDSPAWSPSGDRITFRSDRGGDTKSYSIRPDGTDESLSPHQR